LFEIKPKITVSALFITTVIGESFRAPTHGLYIIGISLLGYVIYYLIFWQKGDKNKAKIIFPVIYLLIGALYFNGFLSKAANLPDWISGEGLQGAILSKHLVYVTIYFGDLSDLFIRNAGEKLILSYKWVAALLAVGVALIQFSSLFLVLVPKAWRFLIIASLIIFHVSIYKILGIAFIPNIIILTYLLLDWPAVAGFILTKAKVYLR
jgi:hypothetical protein